MHEITKVTNPDYELAYEIKLNFNLKINLQKYKF